MGGGHREQASDSLAFARSPIPRQRWFPLLPHRRLYEIHSLRRCRSSEIAAKVVPSTAKVASSRSAEIVSLFVVFVVVDFRRRESVTLSEGMERERRERKRREKGRQRTRISNQHSTSQSRHARSNSHKRTVPTTSLLLLDVLGLHAVLLLLRRVVLCGAVDGLGLLRVVGLLLGRVGSCRRGSRLVSEGKRVASLRSLLHRSLSPCFPSESFALRIEREKKERTWHPEPPLPLTRRRIRTPLILLLLLRTALRFFRSVTAHRSLVRWRKCRRACEVRGERERREGGQGGRETEGKTEKESGGRRGVREEERKKKTGSVARRGLRKTRRRSEGGLVNRAASAKKEGERKNGGREKADREQRLKLRCNSRRHRRTDEYRDVREGGSCSAAMERSQRSSREGESGRKELQT